LQVDSHLLRSSLRATIMVKFLWDTCVYFSPMHIVWTSDASHLPPFNVGHKQVHFQPCTLFSLYSPQATLNGRRGLQKNPEYVIKSDLKHKTLYCPNEFVYDCSSRTPFTIFQLSVMHSVCPPKFCINYCCEILLGGLHIPKSIPQQ